MSAEFKNLIEIKQVMDHDCGNYYVGELEIRFSEDELIKYLKNHEERGKQDLDHMIVSLAYSIENIYRKLKSDENRACTSSI